MEILKAAIAGMNLIQLIQLMLRKRTVELFCSGFGQVNVDRVIARLSKIGSIKKMVFIQKIIWKKVARESKSGKCSEKYIPNSEVENFCILPANVFLISLRLKRSRWL